MHWTYMVSQKGMKCTFLLQRFINFPIILFILKRGKKGIQRIETPFQMTCKAHWLMPKKSIHLKLFLKHSALGWLLHC